jgi:hypothetical protein
MGHERVYVIDETEKSIPIESGLLANPLSAT